MSKQPYAKSCGGPLLCKSCAMAIAQAYHNAGKHDLAEVYRTYAKRLRDDHEMIKKEFKTG